MIKRRIVAFSHNQLKLDLVNGQVALKSVPRAIRLRNRIFYSYAMKYYNYRQDIDSPYDIYYKDILFLPEGYQKERLIDLYNLYGLDLGLCYQQRRTEEQPRFVQDTGGLMLGKNFNLGKDGKLVIGGYGEGHCIHYVSLKSVSDYLNTEEITFALSALASSSAPKSEAAYACNMFSQAASKAFGSPLKYVSIVGNHLKCYEAYVR